MAHRVVPTVIVVGLAFGFQSRTNAQVAQAPEQPGPARFQCLTPPPEERGFFLQRPWTGGNVYYEFASTITANERQQMLSAWESLASIANVRFLPRPFLYPNYILVTRSTTSGVSRSSHIGMVGGQQSLQIWVTHFNLPGALMHETMHALGLYHEHQRPDRDQFIDVIESAVVPGYLGALSIVTDGITDGVYDFASLMHYDQTGFGVNNSRTILVNEAYRRRWQWSIGQYGRFDALPSMGDRWVLQRLYPGPIAPPPRSFLLLEPAGGEAVDSSWRPTFSWQASESATAYRLQVDDAPTFASPEIDVETTDTSYEHHIELAPDRLYWWRVISSNENGNTAAHPLESMAFYTAPEYPTMLFVDDSAPAGRNGLAWSSALNDLGVATEIAYASGGSVTEIRVAQGNYTPAFGSTDRAMSFWLSNGCALLGGFAGFDAPDPDARDIDLYETVLSGDLLHDDLPDFVNTGDNSNQVVMSMVNSVDALLEGFTIRDGRSETLVAPGAGGGLLVDGGTPTVRLCRFIDNHSDDTGGAVVIAFAGSDPLIDQCDFTGNRMLGPGPHSFFTAGGGALELHNASAHVSNCTFSENTALAGGAVFCLASNPSFVNCQFDHNAATASSGQWVGGGAIMSIQSSHPTLVNSTIVSNSSAVPGGGISKDGSSTTAVRNSILWSNTPNQAPSSVAITYSNVQGVVPPGPGNISIAPTFVDASAADYALAEHSAGIDAASNAFVPVSITTDLAGLARFFDDPSTPDTGATDPARPALALVDMGAFEFQGASCAADWNDDGVVNATDVSDFINAWFEDQVKGTLVTDWDGNGVVNSTDVSDFINAWFEDTAAGCGT